MKENVVTLFNGLRFTYLITKGTTGSIIQPLLLQGYEFDVLF